MSLAILVDGLGHTVPANPRKIEAALRQTDMVEIDGWEIRISNFYSDGGDEIDVYDGRKVYDPQEVFEPSEVKEAIALFMELVEQVRDN